MKPVNLTAEPLKIRFTLSGRVDARVLGDIVNQLRRKIHLLIEAEEPRIDEQLVQPIDGGWALELSFPTADEIPPQEPPSLVTPP